MNFWQEPLYRLPADVETRWLTAENPTGAKGGGGAENFGRKGKPVVEIPAGESHVLADIQGASGTVRRIWWAHALRDPAALRSIRVRMYWDGCSRPAVDAPLGDFFGLGLGLLTPFECALFSNPEGRNTVCTIPMPFRTGAKIVVTNETDRQLGLFYEVDLTLNDPHDDNTLYLHAFWNRQNPTKLREDYEMLPQVAGAGRYLGVNIGVRADTGTYFHSWWGEGEAKIYLDGDRELPTLCGTGTEDYIGTSWGQGRYAHAYQGCPIADSKNFLYCFYRYHLPDPVFFRKDCRVTMQQIGCHGPDDKARFHYTGNTYYTTGETLAPIDFSPGVYKNDYALFERQDDWSSCAYFYLNRPDNDLPELPGVEARTADLPTEWNDPGRADV